MPAFVHAAATTAFPRLTAPTVAIIRTFSDDHRPLQVLMVMMVLLLLLRVVLLPVMVVLLLLLMMMMML